ncbi:uncharacterized protein LOC124912926 [Impatiens glandulifera]|uniref:uncharacterized protein LOC124912926 n=1 Tax=Impatiens glandulifera TaxID=253017 RepID=UPI001FB05964|nr:uncharacterized protein LOC124912926 [Impatiens glandulifera]
MTKEQLIAMQRQNAEVYDGDSMELRRKSREFLERLQMPIGLLPMDNMEELGFNESTGFIWMRQKKPTYYKFRQIGQLVRFDTEITAFLEDRRMRAITGVKGREFLVWIPVNEIQMENIPDPKNITFCTPVGI